jgi:2-dehydro-3-deoxygluconokinase
LIFQGGVAQDFIKWVPHDGVGRTVRNGLNFTERGFGIRGAIGTSDRGNSAASQLKPGDFDWRHIFGRLGVRWFHTGGIFAALSDSTHQLVIEAIQAARKHGVIVSYDLNYRPSLWKSIGGQKKARQINREIARQVDVMIGNEEDLSACLGLEIKGMDNTFTKIDVAHFTKMIEKTTRTYPNLKIVATTLRSVKSATRNDWSAICWAAGKFYQSQPRHDLEIMDRIGGGDSFASGLIYGFLQFNDPQIALEYGAAHGALAMTTPGDTSMVSIREVEALVKGGTARVQR